MAAGAAVDIPDGEVGVSKTKPLLNRYVGQLADLMGLSEWRLRLGDDDADQGNGADVSVIYGMQSATIRFDPEWPDWEPEQLRHYTAHELIHCHTERIDWAVQNIKDGLGHIGWNIFSLSFKDAEEQAIDNIAWAWAQTLPLPVKAKEGR